MEVTQYMRGELFVYLDSIFSYDYANPDVELPCVNKLLDTALQVLCLWLKWFSEHYTSVNFTLPLV